MPSRGRRPRRDGRRGRASAWCRRRSSRRREGARAIRSDVDREAAREAHGGVEDRSHPIAQRAADLAEQGDDVGVEVGHREQELAASPPGRARRRSSSSRSRPSPIRWRISAAAVRPMGLDVVAAGQQRLLEHGEARLHERPHPTARSPGAVRRAIVHTRSNRWTRRPETTVTSRLHRKSPAGRRSAARSTSPSTSSPSRVKISSGPPAPASADTCSATVRAVSSSSRSNAAENDPGDRRLR